MPLGSGFDWDDDELDAYFSRVTDRWPLYERDILRALGEDLVGNIKRDIPVDTGAARSTVRTVMGGGGTDHAEVVAGGMRGVDYIKPLLNGSRPHHPGEFDRSSRLARWARRNNYPGGYDAIYWHIARHGTEPHDFVTEPLARTQADAADIGERVLRRREVFDG